MALQQRPVVLIVDDNEDTGEMYAAGLSQAGFEPIVAHSGSEGLQVAEETVPDVVITDLVLHGPIDGLTLTRRLRADDRTRETGIIVVTGRVLDEDRDEAKRAGCDVFLTKPCLPDQLAAEVERMVSPRHIAKRALVHESTAAK